MGFPSGKRKTHIVLDPWSFCHNHAASPQWQSGKTDHDAWRRLCSRHHEHNSSQDVTTDWLSPHNADLRIATTKENENENNSFVPIDVAFFDTWTMVPTQQDNLCVCSRTFPMERGMKVHMAKKGALMHL